MMDWLRDLDSQIYQLVNVTWSNSLLDQVMPTLTDLHKILFVQVVLIPVLLLFWFYKERKKSLALISGLILTITFADGLNYRIFKKSFERARPTFTETNHVLRTELHYGHSFPSNHAVNAFATATYLSYIYPVLTVGLYTLAAVIAYSRVYVGVHYPFDVFVGAIIGTLIGFLMFILLRRFYVRFLEPKGFPPWQKS